MAQPLISLWTLNLLSIISFHIYDKQLGEVICFFLHPTVALEGFSNTEYDQKSHLILTKEMNLLVPRAKKETCEYFKTFVYMTQISCAIYRLTLVLKQQRINLLFGVINHLPTTFFFITTNINARRVREWHKQKVIYLHFKNTSQTTFSNRFLCSWPKFRDINME